MTLSQRDAIGLLVVTLAGAVGYVAWLVVAVGRTPLDQLDYRGPISTVAIAMTWAFVGARAWARHSTSTEDRAADERDRTISRRAESYGCRFLLVAVIAISLLAGDRSPAWSANALFTTFLAASILVGASMTVLYRRS